MTATPVTFGLCRPLANTHKKFDEALAAVLLDVSGRPVVTSSAEESGGRRPESPVSLRFHLWAEMRRQAGEMRRAAVTHTVFTAFESSSAASFLAFYRHESQRLFFYVHNNLQRALDGTFDGAALRTLIMLVRRRKKTFLLFPEEKMVEKASEMFPGAADRFLWLPLPIPHYPEYRAVVPSGVAVLGASRAEKEAAWLAPFRESLPAELKAILDLPSMETSTMAVVPDSEYWSRLASAGWVLLPYGGRYEYRSSGVLYDAVAIGRPVIVRRMPVFEDIIESARGPIGFLFDSPAELTQILEKVRRMSRQEWETYASAVKGFRETRRSSVREAVLRMAEM
jgi:hypothetical protein